MKLLRKLFGFRKTPYVSKVDVLAKMSWMTTLEECKDVSGMINNLTLKVNKQPLRDELCDKTVKIFLGQYGSKSV
jgi:hypothetical protein